MKYALLSLLISSGLLADTTISGKVSSFAECSKKVMVWLSLDKDNYQERLLLMHTEVPIGGSFQFYVRPGNYQVRASDESGCEYMEKVSVKDKGPELNVKLVKK